MCDVSYSVSVPAPVTAVACKRPWSFCQKCRWQVTSKYTYTLDPTDLEWAGYAAVQAVLSRNKLTHNLLGNIRSQFSQLAEPLWSDPGIGSGICVCELISTKINFKKRRRKKQKKSAGGKRMVQLSPPDPRKRGNSRHHHHHHHNLVCNKNKSRSNGDCHAWVGLFRHAAT